MSLSKKPRAMAFMSLVRGPRKEIYSSMIQQTHRTKTKVSQVNTYQVQ